MNAKNSGRASTSFSREEIAAAAEIARLLARNGDARVMARCSGWRSFARKVLAMELRSKGASDE